MIKSMTGFGRGEYSDAKRNIIAEIKSVNHRYNDISVRLPRRYSFAEDKIKSMVKKTAKRGKIEVSIMVESITEEDVMVRLNTMVAGQYYENLKALKNEFNVTGDINLQFLATLPDVMKAVPDVDDEEEMIKAIEAAVRQAAESLDAMRAVEGEKLAEDLKQRGKVIRKYVEEISEKAEEVPKLYAAKLAERISHLLDNNVTVPEDRIMLEAAIFADKCSITEELVRLDSHIIQMDNILSKSNQPDGKKLDFLVQEMNREANTIGSKANDIGITSLMLEIKSEIEKIREQVQNIE